MMMKDFAAAVSNSQVIEFLKNKNIRKKRIRRKTTLTLILL
jgi:hypothetical protein